MVQSNIPSYHHFVDKRFQWPLEQQLEAYHQLKEQKIRFLSYLNALGQPRPIELLEPTLHLVFSTVFVRCHESYLVPADM